MLYFESLSGTDASLLLGIVLGIKGEFSKQFLSDLQSAGVLHVIAASGMNVVMVSGFIYLLSVSIFRRQYAVVLVIAGVIFYAVISGLQPSIVRAGIMACFAFSAQLLGRQYTGLYGLFLTGFFMLFIKPELVFDIGFQLSVMSTLGILVIKPVFPRNKIFDDLATTLSAQVMTLPIIFVNFGQYGLLSILVNFLILWTIPVLMILGGIGAIIGFVFEPAGKLIILSCIPLLWWFEMIVTYFGELKLNLTMSGLPIAIVAGYYLILFSIIFIFWERKKSLELNQ